MKINLNDKIKVKLTTYGQNIHLDYYRDILEKYSTDIFEKYPSLRQVLKIDQDGYTEYQLWEFINIFGDHICMGAQNVIEPLDIYFDGGD